MFKKFTIIILFFASLAFVQDSKKIGGVNFVSPSHKSEFTNFLGLQRINAKWIAFNPYAFSKKNEPNVKYDYQQSWWGEKLSGVEEMLIKAKQENLKVMLKPHVWVVGQGWCGEYDLNTEAEWEIWEKEYQAYIIAYSKMAERQEVEMICIGTEYKIAATKRVAFWKHLIKEVRKIYKGKLTYAANWDNFHNIKFWKELDYIGIDAYFPLSASKTANKKELDEKWMGVNKTLQQFSESFNKQIVFTEYGYKSVHYSAGKQWEIEGVKEDDQVNIAAQNNAYTSLYQNIWNEQWFAGGFIWKWYPNDKESGGLLNSDYTPQHKPVEQIIKQYY